MGLQKIKYGVSLVIIAMSFSMKAQNIVDTTILAPIFNVTYAGQMPLFDMAKRFGLNSSLGISGGIKTAKNWQFELEGNFLFSQNIKEPNLLASITTSSGQIVGNDGGPVGVIVYERGLVGTFNVGKIFPIIGPNPNSGLIVKLGGGFIRHKLKIENELDLVPLLSKENLVYFDRLTLGVMVKEYIGYQHLGNTNLTNFTVGLEFLQGFTQGMRDYQIDLEAPYRDKRLDFFIGLRVGWVIPVYRKAPSY